MIQFLEERRDELEALCRRYGIVRFEVFGSAATGHFNPEKSDLDFLVEFQPMEPPSLADAYFGLLEALRKLFDREVDLVTPRAIRNRYFRQEIDRTRKLLYAA